MSLAAKNVAAFFENPPPGEPFSVARDGSQQKGRSPVYRHWKQQGDELLTTLDPAVTTVHELFEQSANEHADLNCLGHRKYDENTQSYGQYEWIDYKTVHGRKADFAAGLAKLLDDAGLLQEEEQCPVGLWCSNRPAWQIVDLACMSQSFFTVSLYDTLGAEATEHIINNASLPAICVSSEHVSQLQHLRSKCPSLKYIITLDTPTTTSSANHLAEAIIVNDKSPDMLQVYSMTEVEVLGQNFPRPSNPPRPESIITINYTSGTTGLPKGVVLTHAAAVAGASAGIHVLNAHRGDSICSFLPLAHIFERVVEAACLWAGASIGYYSGDVQRIVDDLKALRPTLMVSVPRLYSRIGAGLKQKTLQAPGITGMLSRYITSSKMAAIEDPFYPSNKHMLWDYIWGSKVKAALGLDRCRTMITGSAPIDPALQQYLRVVFGNELIQGYGLTETYATVLAQSSSDLSAGNCGAVVPTAEICLEDVPDLDYLATDKPNARGELLIRATTLFKGYHKDPVETAKVFTEDGWFRTGDICEIDNMGRVKVIDRRKNILKLAQGEYVSPERIENVFLSNVDWMSQVMVHGDSEQAALVAVVGIQPDRFAAFANKVYNGTRTIDPGELHAMIESMDDKTVLAAALKELAAIGAREGLNGFEKVKSIRLLVEPFSVKNDLLTQTLKLRRQHAARQYRSLLDQMYAEIAKSQC